MGVIAETADRVAVMYAGRIVEIGAVRDVLHAPQHPYTAGLMASIPRIAAGARRSRLAQIEGAMPRLDAIPRGCPFHPRCAKRFEHCLSSRPELMPAEEGQAACWLHASAIAQR
jgi:peptide/nickel transport system ATP-binding protein